LRLAANLRNDKFQRLLEIAEQQIRDGKRIMHDEFWREVGTETQKLHEAFQQ